MKWYDIEVGQVVMVPFVMGFYFRPGTVLEKFEELQQVSVRTKDDNGKNFVTLRFADDLEEWNRG